MGLTVDIQDGIFDVLSRSFLSAVQLSIILDKNDVGKVVESYTFNFTYGSVTSIKPPSKKHQAMIIYRSQGNPITITTARGGLEMISRYLIQLTQHLPDLPGKSSTWMEILIEPSHAKIPKPHAS